MSPTARRLFNRVRNRPEWWAAAAVLAAGGIICWGIVA